MREAVQDKKFKNGLGKNQEKEALNQEAAGMDADGNEFERCVLCRKRLDVLKNREIDFRAFYIEGAGQLCYDCYQELYG